MLGDKVSSIYKVPIDFSEANVELYIKREDLLHPEISGNKYRKLKYNLLEAKSKGINKILTFGGAFSNHIAATAAAGAEFNFETIGVIRGEELENKIEENPTLVLAKSKGMQLHFVSRTMFRDKYNPEFIAQLKDIFGDFFLVPEGGTNAFAVKGCEEILNQSDDDFNYICCAVGTGGTIAGIINSSNENQEVIGFPALKGDFLSDEIKRFTTKTNWKLNLDYHFGGYAKINSELVSFINQFKIQTNIPLDPVYTGKMCFGVLDLIQKSYFKPNSKILLIHTGGLQGIKGMNQNLEKNNLPLIYV